MRFHSVGAIMIFAGCLFGGAEEIGRHPEWDQVYSKQIRELTTGPELSTDLVDHLPASESVPTPLKILGHVAGAKDQLTYSSDVHRYMRALESATPRVKVFSIGKSEEGREMILVAIADEATIGALDQYRETTRKLSDPRRLSAADAEPLLKSGKPIYYLTGAMHSPETGSPEMLMELAYRLAVEETPIIRGIRDNVITLITPVLEVDGRDRMVDLVRWHQAHPEAGVVPLVYWGHYVAHDNNRDAMGLGLALTRNVLRVFMDWHPQVIHDLHESIPFLYISTGTGPYNAWLDPIAVEEWERMASNEVQVLTRKGLPGVWTHGFYDGWAPNYMFWVAHGHNAIGRFYETFGNSLPSTEDRVVRDFSKRAWFRPNPPLPKVMWSLRNNVNYQESGVITALDYAAQNREHMLRLFWDLGERAIAKATTEGPAAYVFDSAQKRTGQLRDLLNLLRAHGIEVDRAENELTVTQKWPPSSEGEAASKQKAKSGEASDEKKDEEKKKEEGPLRFAAGSFIVRMDQPYSRLADALLDTQYVRGEERVYDDTGWTFGYLKNVEWKRIVAPDVLKVPMKAWDGSLPASGTWREGAAVAIANEGDTDLVRLRTALPQASFRLAEEELKGKKSSWPAGTVFIALEAGSAENVRAAVTATSLRFEVLDRMPTIRMRDLPLPRIAILHTWLETQDEGWFRLAFEALKVPYTYISTQDVSSDASLRSSFDVIVFPPADASPQDIVNGLPPGPPLPWLKSDLTPNLGVDETADIRPGLGLSGVVNLDRFVQGGGLLITVRETAGWAVQYGLARWVTVDSPSNLNAHGSILAANVADTKSPIVLGLGDSIPVYFSDGPVLKVGLAIGPRLDREQQRPSGRGSKSDPDVPQGRPFVETPERPKPGVGEEGFQRSEDFPFFVDPYIPRMEDRPRVILSFPKEGDKLLLSGMLEGADSIAGKPALVDCPRGKGHVLLFACNPMWRMNTQGNYALMFNAILNFDSLGYGWPPAKKTPDGEVESEKR